MKDGTEFLIALEKYYALRYDNEFEFNVLVKWIDAKISPDKFLLLFDSVTNEHSRKWKSLPDKSIINEVSERLFGNQIDSRAETAWQSLITMSSLYDVMIVDRFAFFVVAGYGTWHEFCNNRDGYRELTHKTFIQRYISAVRAGVNPTPRLLIGENVWSEPHPDYMRVIGDEAEGMKLIGTKVESLGIEFFKNVSDF